MAIASNRTSNKNITTLIDKNYLSAVDKTKDSPANTTPDFKPIAESSKKATKIGKKNIFSTSAQTTIGNALLGMSIFPDNADPSCDQGASTKPKKKDDREIKAPKKNSGCPSNSDSIALNTVLSHVTEGLPENMVVAIEGMLSEQAGALSKGITSLGTVNKNDQSMRGISSISKALSDVGSPLKEKVHFKSLLSCLKMSGSNGGESSLIKGAVIAGLLAQSLCMSVNKLIATISELSANNINVNGDVVKGVATAFVSAQNKPAGDKVGIMASIGTLVGGLSASDKATISTKATEFMQSLSTSKPSGNDPSKEYGDALAAMGTLDLGWAIGSNGKPNMCTTKGNDYFSILGDSFLKSQSSNPTTLPSNPIALQPTDPGYLAKLITASNVSKNNITDGNILTTIGYS